MFDRLPHDLQRLRLRVLREDDLAAFHAYRSDPDVARYQGWEPMTTAQAADFLAAQNAPVAVAPGAWRQLGVAERGSDRLLGDAGVRLAPDRAQAEFGLSIARPAQGRGYGRECVRGLIGLLFSATSVAEILARSDARNAACLAVLAHAGMRHADTRQAEYKGETCTERVFAIRRNVSFPGR